MHVSLVTTTYSQLTMKEEFRTHLLDLSTTNYRNIDNGDQTTEAAIVEKTTLTPITLTLALSTFVLVMGSLSFGFVIGYSSPVQSEMMNELGLSISQYSLFGSMYNIGGAVGAILCGKLTDWLGRRHALGLADVFYILGWFSIAICQDAWLLDLGRWMLGFSSAICSFVVPIYIAEFTPRNLRGGFVVFHVLMLATGTSVVFLLGLIVHWRNLALICLIPSLVQIIGVFFIPESPRWLMMIGKDEEFEAALRRFRGPKIDISCEASDIKVFAEGLHEKQQVSVLKLFRKKYAYTLTVGIGLSILPMLSGINAIIGYSSSIFESAGFSRTIGTVALAIFQLPTVVLSIFLTDKFGRRPLMMISSAGLWLGCMLAGLSFMLQDHQLLKGFSPYLALTGILVYIGAYPVGLGGAAAVIVSEIYPLNIKGSAGSVGALVSWLLGWFVSYVFNFLMDWSPSGTFFVMASICGGILIFAARLVPETRGKTLEEVHLLMANVWQ